MGILGGHIQNQVAAKLFIALYAKYMKRWRRRRRRRNKAQEKK